MSIQASINNVLGALPKSKAAKTIVEASTSTLSYQQKASAYLEQRRQELLTQQENSDRQQSALQKVLSQNQSKLAQMESGPNDPTADELELHKEQQGKANFRKIGSIKTTGKVTKERKV